MRASTVLVLLAAGLALALRLPHLAERPMHGDEAVNAVKFRDLYEHGRYVYDPSQFHGPTLYYLTLPSAWTAARIEHGGWIELTETPYRLVAVACGVGMILLLLLVRDGLGPAATAWAALLTALSPGMVYYSRYYIHETPLVLFTFGAIASGWRATRATARRRRVAWAGACGLCLGLMHATKETCFIAGFAMAVALGLARAWGRRPAGGRRAPAPPAADAETGARPAGAAMLLAAVASGLAVSVLLHSAFFTHPRGVIDAVRMVTHYLGRAGQSIHLHPWDFYLRRLLYWKPAPGPWWSEGLIVALAAVTALAALLPARRPGPAPESGDGPLHPAAPQTAEPQHAAPGVAFIRFLLLYTVVLTTIYCLIPYKTPWNALGFLHGMVLCAGVGAAALVRAMPGLKSAGLAALVVLAGSAHLGWQARRATGLFAADQRNPYVYGHTTGDAPRIAELAETLARHPPAGGALVVKVIAENYWPLPWYFRRLERICNRPLDQIVGFYDHAPDAPDAPMIVVSDDLAEAVASRLGNEKDYFTPSPRGLRPGVIMVLFVQKQWRPAPRPPATTRPNLGTR